MSYHFNKLNRGDIYLASLGSLYWY